jgi:hypothetical protein
VGHVPGARLERWSALALALFCVFVAGEEISWGQRLLGFRPPNFFLEKNFQQEANLHNLLKNILDTRFIVMAIALLYGVIAPYLARLRLIPRVFAAEFALLPWFAAVAWLELSYPYELVGELAELMLGMLFLVDLVARSRPTGAVWGPRAALLQIAALAIAGPITPLYDAFLRLSPDEYALVARDDLNTLRERISAGEVVTEKLARKKRVHKRVYTAVRAGYLELDPKRHYLDPWNSPYWVVYQRGVDGAEPTMLLYSFGPNRRRDLPLSDGESGTTDAALLRVLESSEPARAAAPPQAGQEPQGLEFSQAGDDIGVVVRLPGRVQAKR